MFTVIYCNIYYHIWHNCSNFELDRFNPITICIYYDSVFPAFYKQNIHCFTSQQIWMMIESFLAESNMQISCLEWRIQKLQIWGIADIKNWIGVSLLTSTESTSRNHVVLISAINHLLRLISNQCIDVCSIMHTLLNACCKLVHLKSFESFESILIWSNLKGVT